MTKRRPNNNRHHFGLTLTLALAIGGGARALADAPAPPASTAASSASNFTGAGDIPPRPTWTYDPFATDQSGLPIVETPIPMADIDADPFLPPSTMPAGPAAVNAVPPPPSPAGVNSPAPASSTVTPPPTYDEAHSVILENADSAEEVEQDHWIVIGDIRVRYQKYVITSDRADIDTEAQTALFSGHVLMSAPTGEVVEGGPLGTLKIDLDANSYVVTNSEATVPASRFGIGLIEPLHIYDGVLRGQPNLIDARGCSFTTCDFVDPHYHFTATDMYIVPGRKLVAKHVSLYRRDHRLITWPYLVVPLDQRVATLTPQFGETPDEGYFVKIPIGYMLTSTLPGILHVDLYQKMGVGVGVDQSYGNPNNIKDGSGEVSLYELPNISEGRETYTGSLTHRQEFGNVTANLTTQLEDDSYLLGNTSSQSLSSQITLNRNVGNMSTSLSMNISDSNYSGSTSDTITSSLDNTFSPTSKEHITTKFDLSDYTSSFGGTSTETSQLNSDIEYDEQDTHFDWKVMANKYSALSGGEGASALGGVEKMPEFDLSTDPIRAALLKSVLPKTAKLDFSYGYYKEPASNMQGQRLNIDLDTGTNTFKLDSWQAIDLDGTFLQRFYSDNAAQYILTDHDDYRLRIGNKSTAAIRYDYLRPYGFTPFEFDFSGVTNLLSANLAYQETKAFQMNLSSGYDINAARQQSTFGPPQPWQDIALQSLYTPTNYFLWRASSSYDLNHGQLIDFTNNWSARGRFGQALDMGLRYTPQEHRVSAITEQFDIPLVLDRREESGWRLQTVAGYDGLTDSFDYSGVALTRSWHDWEATFIYQNNPIGFQTGSAFTFNIRLKAFPASQTFGTGTFGQSLGTGLGTVY